MDLTNIHDLKGILKKYKLWAKKRLGQHFLIDRSVLDTITDTAKLTPEDTVLEIGAGTGVLTRELLPRVKKVIAVEIDTDILPVLKETTHFFRDRLEIRHEHVLNIQLPEEEYKVVANIPYNLTSPILRKTLVEAKHRPTSLTLLVQKEVAEKICNPKRRSILSLFVEAFGEARIIGNVPKGAFHPPPKVESAVLHIDVFPDAKITIDPKLFFALVKQGFNAPRKKLKNNLPLELLEAAKIDPDQRAETLSLEEWERLAVEWK